MTTRSLPRPAASSLPVHGDEGRNRARLAGDASPVQWETERAEPLLATSSGVTSPQVGDWVPEDTALEDDALILSQIEERVIDGVPHLKVILRPVVTASAFADEEEVDDLRDDGWDKYTRLNAERTKREERRTKRKNVIRYGSLGAVLIAVVGLIFYLSPVGQELMTTTETVTVEVEKTKEYTGELLD